MRKIGGMKNLCGGFRKQANFDFAISKMRNLIIKSDQLENCTL